MRTVRPARAVPPTPRTQVPARKATKATTIKARRAHKARARQAKLIQLSKIGIRPLLRTDVCRRPTRLRRIQRQRAMRALTMVRRRANLGLSRGALVGDSSARFVVTAWPQVFVAAIEAETPPTELGALVVLEPQ